MQGIKNPAAEPVVSRATGDVHAHSVGDLYPFNVIVRGEIHVPGARRYQCIHLYSADPFGKFPLRATYKQAEDDAIAALQVHRLNTSKGAITWKDVAVEVRRGNPVAFTVSGFVPAGV